jgi:Zn-dependent protease
VRWAGVGVDPTIAATVSLAGPFFGFIAGLIAYGVFLQTHQGVWLGVAQFTAFLNLLNLIPVWIFDGARAMTAVAKQERIAIAVVSFALALLLHSVVAAVVGVATLCRLASRDFPSASKQRIAYTFIALVIATAYLDWFCTQQRLLLFGR